MKLQLKQLKTAGGDETLRFTAQIYLDNSKIATVSNGGTGGGHQYDFFRTDNRKTLMDYIDRFKTDIDLVDPLHQKVSESLQSLQKVIPTFTQQEIDADMVVDCAIELQEQLKYFKRQCKDKTLFHLPEDPKDTYLTVNQTFSPEVESWIIAKYGLDVIIINKLLDSQS
ncbi:hypothetical protein [Chamaesiphon sp.]|uniref:hypothetical protein n=1 Tax=Chamaesiphon sp. TaxID=2814140 RepID=UPI00359313D1